MAEWPERYESKSKAFDFDSYLSGHSAITFQLTAKIPHIFPYPLLHVQFWMDSFHIWHNNHYRERVCRMQYILWAWPISSMLFSCDVYWYYHIHMWHKYNPWGDDVSRTISGSICHYSLGLLRSGRVCYFNNPEYHVFPHDILSHVIVLIQQVF